MSSFVEYFEDMNLKLLSHAGIPPPPPTTTQRPSKAPVSQNATQSISAPQARELVKISD